MRKVINFTLMTTVAIALLGLQTVAFGMAPVISGVPDPIIVGDVELSTPDANFFVFPDAINLANFVGDESILPENLIWTYALSSGSGRYVINGVPALNLTTENAQTPPPAKQINLPANVSLYEWNPDNDANTITVRNNLLTPLSATPHVGNYPDPAPNTNGILASETEIVTLFCSDGTALAQNWDSVDVTFKTDNFTFGADGIRGTADDGIGGNDRVGSQPRAAQLLRQLDFVANGPGTGTTAWVSGDVVNAATFSTVNGLSINVPALGDNIGMWTSPDNYISLVANSVWRLRMTVTSNQATPYQVPLWDMIVENYRTKIVGNGPDGLPNTADDVKEIGPYAYGLDYFFLDNSGGANAAGDVGRKKFEIWYTPAPIQAAHFNNATTGIFAPALDGDNDLRVRFRVLDAGSAGINANIDEGTVSLQNLEIHRFDLAKVNATSIFNAATIKDGSHNENMDATSFTVTYLEGTIVDFSGNAVTLSPENAAAGWAGLPGGAEVILVQPGDGFFNPITGLSVEDNYPVAWESDTLYRTQVVMTAPNALGQTNPPDLVSIIVDTPHNELTAQSYMTPSIKFPNDATGLNVTMPRTASATYQSFFYSHSTSRTAIGSLRTFRPLVQVICANWLVLGGVAQNTGGIRINSVNVSKVTFND